MISRCGEDTAGGVTAYSSGRCWKEDDRDGCNDTHYLLDSISITVATSISRPKLPSYHAPQRRRRFGIMQHRAVQSHCTPMD